MIDKWKDCKVVLYDEDDYFCDSIINDVGFILFVRRYIHEANLDKAQQKAAYIANDFIRSMIKRVKK